MPRKKKVIDLEKSELLENFHAQLKAELDLILIETEPDLIILELAFWRLAHRMEKYKKTKAGAAGGKRFKERKLKAYAILTPIYEDMTTRNGKRPSPDAMIKKMSRMGFDDTTFSEDPNQDALVKPQTIRSFTSFMRKSRSMLPSSNTKS
jgi:hypothetical protein